MPTRDDYDELREEVYLPLVHRHQELKSRINGADSPERVEQLRAEAKGVIESISSLEALLNEWDDRLDDE